MSGLSTPVTSLVTSYGRARSQQAKLEGFTIGFKFLKVGDGPITGEALGGNEVYEAPVRSVYIDADHPDQVIAVAIIPATAGPFVMGSLALIDDQGEVYAVSNYTGITHPGPGGPLPEARRILFALREANAEVVDVFFSSTGDIPEGGDILLRRLEVKESETSNTSTVIEPNKVKLELEYGSRTHTTELIGGTASFSQDEGDGRVNRLSVGADGFSLNLDMPSTSKVKSASLDHRGLEMANDSAVIVVEPDVIRIVYPGSDHEAKIMPGMLTLLRGLVAWTLQVQPNGSLQLSKNGSVVDTWS